MPALVSPMYHIWCTYSLNPILRRFRQVRVIVDILRGEFHRKNRGLDVLDDQDGGGGIAVIILVQSTYDTCSISY